MPGHWSHRPGSGPVTDLRHWQSFSVRQPSRGYRLPSRLHCENFSCRNRAHCHVQKRWMFASCRERVRKRIVADDMSTASGDDHIWIGIAHGDSDHVVTYGHVRVISGRAKVAAVSDANPGEHIVSCLLDREIHGQTATHHAHAGMAIDYRPRTRFVDDFGFRGMADAAGPHS